MTKIFKLKEFWTKDRLGRPGKDTQGEDGGTKGVAHPQAEDGGPAPEAGRGEGGVASGAVSESRPSITLLADFKPPVLFCSVKSLSL